jgi:hypothetical protein
VTTQASFQGAVDAWDTSDLYRFDVTGPQMLSVKLDGMVGRSTNQESLGAVVKGSSHFHHFQNQSPTFETPEEKTIAPSTQTIAPLQDIQTDCADEVAEEARPPTYKCKRAIA